MPVVAATDRSSSAASSSLGMPVAPIIGPVGEHSNAAMRAASDCASSGRASMAPVTRKSDRPGCRFATSPGMNRSKSPRSMRAHRTALKTALCTAFNQNDRVGPRTDITADRGERPSASERATDRSAKSPRAHSGTLAA